MSQANGWLRRWLINPAAFYLSVGVGARGAHAAFSVTEALKAPGRILIVPDCRAGGLLLGASQFWAIRRRYPDSKISLLTPSQREYIAREIPFVDDVIAYEDFLIPLGGKLRDTVGRLRQGDFNIAFCFSSEESFCPAYLCYKSGAHLRIGFERDDFPFFNIRIVPRQEACYEPERFSLLISTLGIPQVRERISWSVSKKGAKKIRDRYLVGRKSDERFVGLDISNSTGDGLTRKQIHQIAQEAVASPGVRLLIFFDYAERKTANRIREALGQKVLLFQIDDLPRIVALLEACCRLIACNTDLFHLAVAMGVPVTGIFARKDIVRWVPPDRKGIEILEHESLKAWDPRQVRESIRNLLSSTAPRKEAPRRR